MYKLNALYLVFKSFSSLEVFSNILCGQEVRLVLELVLRMCQAWAQSSVFSTNNFKTCMCLEPPVMLTVLYEENDP